MDKQNENLSILLPKLLQDSSLTNLRPEYRRRLEIMLRTNLGESQAEICAALGCSPETARYWMAMVKTGQVDKWDKQPPGRPKTVNAQYLKRLRELVNGSPKDYGYSFERWTAGYLGKHLAKELGIEVSNRHISRLLKQMGLSTGAKNKYSGKDHSITIADLKPS